MSIIPGVIRWPAFYSQDSSSRAAQNNLGLDVAFHNRAPWYSSVVSPYKINCIGSQSTMDMEIQLAAQAGIKHWAWNWYGGQPPFTGGHAYTSTGLQAAFEAYRASAYKSALNFSLLLGIDNFSSTSGFSGNWQGACDYWVSLFADSAYQKVLSNRPLVFMGWSLGSFATFYGSSYTNTATMVAYLQTKCAAAGLGNPYIVLTGGYLTLADPLANFPADAISLYGPAVAGSALPNTFADLDAQQQTYWAGMATVGALVPNCAAGWDTRPRISHQTPWNGPIIPRSGMLQYFPIATPAQMATHLGHAVSYINANPARCPAGSFLAYAWDEFDEGGGIGPTLGDPPIRTDAAYITWQAAHGGPAALPTSNLLAAIGAALRGA